MLVYQRVNKPHLWRLNHGWCPVDFPQPTPEFLALPEENFKAALDRCAQILEGHPLLEPTGDGARGRARAGFEMLGMVGKLAQTLNDLGISFRLWGLFGNIPEFLQIHLLLLGGERFIRHQSLIFRTPRVFGPPQVSWTQWHHRTWGISSLPTDRKQPCATTSGGSEDSEGAHEMQKRVATTNLMLVKQ